MDKPDQQRDFFVSYTQADRAWAEWLAWELEAAGYTTLLQAWDMPPGTAFVHAMDQAVQHTRHILLVLSPAYLRSAMAEAEWRPGFKTDPSGERRRLLPVRVEDCQPAGLLADRVYVDLVGLDEATTRATLLDGVAAALRGHARPATGPRFPRAPAVAAVDRPRFPTALPPVWNVPYRRNPDFTGRGEVLTRLAAALGQGETVAVTQVLQGGGGVGKTALATEYAYQQRARFDTVWWIHAEEPATLVSDYTGLAVTLGLVEAGQADQQLAAVAVRRWLDDHDRWLLIFDNAQAPDTSIGLHPPVARLVDLLPQVVRGQVLVTSRDASWEQHATLAELEVFTEKEAVNFLLARSGSGDPATAAQIAELLGWLPLALEQAGAYVRETRLPLVRYLERLQRFPALTLTRGRPRDRDPADTVASTWQVSLERVRPVPGAVALLEVCAFLGPEEIPRELFAQPLDPPAQGLDILAHNPFALDEAIAALRRFGLAKADEQTLTVHRLLQQVVRDRLEPATATIRAATAARIILAAFPEHAEETETWPVAANLLSHASAAIGHPALASSDPRALIGLLNHMGSYFWGRGEHIQAERLFRRALSMAKANLQPDQLDTARSLSNLATVLHAVGDLRTAHDLHERALAICEAQAGPNHPETARNLSRLAGVLQDQGDLVTARTLLERALAIRETQLGPNHRDTAKSLNNLALVLRDQGDLTGARTLHERALHIHETRLGPDHPAVADRFNDVALVLRDQGDLTGARTLHERALHIHETRLGSHHLGTAHSLTYLALVLRDQGDLAGARTLHERALQIREARLGPDHPDTLQSRQDLAAVVAALDKQQ